MTIISVAVEGTTRKFHGHVNITIDDSQLVTELVEQFCKTQGTPVDPKYGLVNSRNVTLAKDKPISQFKVKDGDLLMLVNLSLRGRNSAASRRPGTGTPSTSTVSKTISRSAASHPSSTTTNRPPPQGNDDVVKHQFWKWILISTIIMTIGVFFMIIAFVVNHYNGKEYQRQKDQWSAARRNTTEAEKKEIDAHVPTLSNTDFILLLTAAIAIMVGSIAIFVFAFVNREKMRRGPRAPP